MRFWELKFCSQSRIVGALVLAISYLLLLEHSHHSCPGLILQGLIGSLISTHPAGGATMADRVGQQLGNYHLVKLLGRGNWASVYLGQHLYLNTQAALKVLDGQLADPEVEAFLSEARMIARLRHPHIVQVLDFGVEGATPFLVMDYAPGSNLRQRYPQGTRLPLDTVVTYVKQVAGALQYAHQEKVIHRDIKPENMLLGQYNEVLLSDFGIAILAQSSHSELAQDTAGTIAYMAPEQIQAHPSPASDQYALGIVVYEWLRGERPFDGTPMEIAIKHALVPPPSLMEKVPGLPLEVEHVVLRALAKEPRSRFASVKDFATALEEASQATLSERTQLVLPAEVLARGEHNSNQLQGRSHHLPAQITSLIGREQDVAKACALLQRADVRLVTLTGTGGIGKTRLGLEVAHCQLDAFDDGACFVPLATISDPAFVLDAIAQALGIKEAGERPLLDLLKAFLEDKHLLLLLDNFEQVLAAAPALSDLLAGCPHLKILVTSRAVLRIQGEYEFPVPPLVLPDLAHLPEHEQLVQYPAVALFIARAQSIKPDFVATPASARVIVKICARLDGLPLAIELAAMRIKLLPPQALLQRLEHRLTVLTGGTRDVPARQQTLHNTIAWSYQLLDDREQRLFRRLCVFVGGCTLEAIESISGALGDEASLVLDGVASLIDKSLLQQTGQEAQEPRLVVLETIREYGWEALAESQELESTRRAHVRYYLNLAEQAEPELGGPQQAAWLVRLEREHDNLRAALSRAVEQEAARKDGQHMELALRLAGALRRFWLVHGHISEGRNILEQALAASEGVEAPVRAKALLAAAHLAAVQGDYERTEALCRESLQLYRELADRSGIARSLYLLGEAAWTTGDTAKARALFEEALALRRELEDRERVAYSLYSLALLERSQGEYARSRTLFEESLSMNRELGNKRGIAILLMELAGTLFVSQGDHARVRLLLEEALALYKEVGDKEGLAASLCLTGQIALSEGDAVAAHRLAEESQGLYREMMHRHGIASSLALLARVAVFQGDYTAARSLYEESLALAREVGHKELIASGLEGMASVVAVQGEPAWATQLWGAAESLRIASGMPLAPVERAGYEQAVAAARDRLGERLFAAGWAEGRNVTPEQALAAQGQKPAPSPARTVTPAPGYPAGLTAREVEVLRMVAKGLTNAQIAKALVLSEKTVATHLTHIFNKTNTENRAAAVAFAMRHGLD